MVCVCFFFIYVSSVLCYNHSSSINSSLLHLPKTWIVSNSFTTIRGSTLQANMSGVGYKGKKNAFMSWCDLFKWDLEPGSEILFSCVRRTSFFITGWEKLMCVKRRNRSWEVWSCPDQRNTNLDHCIFHSSCRSLQPIPSDYMSLEFTARLEAEGKLNDVQPALYNYNLQMNNFPSCCLHTALPAHDPFLVCLPHWTVSSAPNWSKIKTACPLYCQPKPAWQHGCVIIE